MSFDTIKGVPINNIITYIINGESFREELNKYKGTSLKSANKFLQSNLQEEEKEALYLHLRQKLLILPVFMLQIVLLQTKN